MLNAHKLAEQKFLPGLHKLPNPYFDQVLLAFAPHPTNKPHPVLPRYIMNLSQFDHEGNHDDSEGSNSALEAAEKNPLLKFD